MRKAICIGTLVIISTLLAGCATAATPTETTASKPVNIKVETNPAPAMMGDTELILDITGADGKPVEGATVDISVKHTDMNGMDMNGTATDQGSGRYSIKANFSMSGTWKLTVYVRKDGLDYKEEIELPVQ